MCGGGRRISIRRYSCAALQSITLQYIHIPASSTITLIESAPLQSCVFIKVLDGFFFNTLLGRVLFGGGV